MKKMILGWVVSMAFVSSAFAMQEFKHSEVSCAEMQAALQADGAIQVNYMIGENIYYRDPSSCALGFHGVDAFDGASDTEFCRLGFLCEKNTRGGSYFNN